MLATAAVGYAVMSHASDPEKEKRLSNVEKLAEALGDRAMKEDAEEAFTLKMCNAGDISNCQTCKRVGILLDKCKEK